MKIHFSLDLLRYENIDQIQMITKTLTLNRYELRIIIYNTVDVPAQEVSVLNESMSDVYVKVFFECSGCSSDFQQTDVHYRHEIMITVYIEFLELFLFCRNLDFQEN